MPKQYYKPHPVQRQRHYGNKTLFVQNRSFQLIPTDLYEQVTEPSLCEWQSPTQVTVNDDNVIVPTLRPRNEGAAKATMWRAIQIRQWVRCQAAEDLVEMNRNKILTLVRRLWRDKALRAFYLAKQEKGSLSPVARWHKGRKRKLKSRLIKDTCINGHPRIQENLTVNGACKICMRITRYNWRLRNLDQDREANRLYSKKRHLAKGRPKRKPRVIGESRTCRNGHQLDVEQAAKKHGCPVCAKIAYKKYRATPLGRAKNAARLREKRRRIKNATTNLRLESD